MHAAASCCGGLERRPAAACEPVPSVKICNTPGAFQIDIIHREANPVELKKYQRICRIKTMVGKQNLAFRGNCEPVAKCLSPFLNNPEKILLVLQQCERVIGSWNDDKLHLSGRNPFL